MKTFFHPKYLAALLLLVSAAASQAFFDSSVGRWASRDPIGESGGINLTSFPSNNPLSQVDYLGLCMCECIDVAITFKPGGNEFAFDFYTDSKGLRVLGNQITAAWTVNGDKTACEYSLVEEGPFKVWWRSSSTDPWDGPSIKNGGSHPLSRSTTVNELGLVVVNSFAHWKIEVDMSQTWRCTGTDGVTKAKTVKFSGTAEYQFPGPKITSNKPGKTTIGKLFTVEN